MTTPDVLLIQTAQGLPSSDSMVYVEACEQANWLAGRQQWSWKLVEGFPTEPMAGIPIGTVEFVHAFLCLRNRPIPKAMNVPAELRTLELLGRQVWEVKDREEAAAIAGSVNAPLLVKPALAHKAFDATTTRYLAELPPDCPLFLSEILKPRILAEWRGFLLRGRILGIRPYVLDAWVCPEREVVQAVADRIRFPAVAADFAVLEDGHTVLLEAHPFFACGLYGFEGPDLLRLAKVAWQALTEAP